MSVIIETSIGDFTVDLYTDERPRCCLNFLKLCKIKYYNFSLFHTVQENLVAQCGDPTATGRGGVSIFGHLYGEQARFFDMEVSPRIKHTKRGLISMVNNGSDMHGSQFVITLAENLDYLDGKHTVFGEVAEGFEILDKLNKTFCDEQFRPHQDIRIYHTVILDDPFDDPDGLDIPAESPGPTQEMLDSDRIACDADIHEDEGKTEEELAEMKAEREAKANAQILEMVGDLPDMDIAPPENVLFVCKLNPVTTSEDLEIIFSRFGTIVSCEVIKDTKTGESLQYAFIEFENKEQCENAYFKMDNVLIDDRRIHVDFSQSVSKIKWKGKGRGVEIMPTGKAPAYVINSQQRRSDGYDLVYEDDMVLDKAKPGGKEKGDKNKKDNSDNRQRKISRSRSRSPTDRNSRRDERRDGGRDRQRDERGRNERDDRGRYERNDRGRYEGRDVRRRDQGRDNWRDRRGSPPRREERRRRSESRERDGRRREQGGSPPRRNQRDRSSESPERREQRDRRQIQRGRERDSSPVQRSDRRRSNSRERKRKRDRSASKERIDRRKTSPSVEQKSIKSRRSDSVDRKKRSESTERKSTNQRKEESLGKREEKNGKNKKSKKKSKKKEQSDSSEDSQQSSDDSESESEEERKKNKKKQKKKKAQSSDEEESERKKKKKKGSKRQDSSEDERNESDSGSDRREKKSDKASKHHKKSKKHHKSGR